MERIGETRNWRRKQTGDPPYLAAKMVHKAGPPLIYDFLQGFVSNITAAFGWSSELSVAIAVLLIVPASIVIGLAFSFSKQRRMLGMTLLTVGIAAYWVLLWVGSRDHLVTAEGGQLRCYTISEEGVTFFEQEQVDPRTGERCRWIDRSNLRYVQAIDQKLRSGAPLQRVAFRSMDEVRLFATGTTGAIPLVWYHRAGDGELEFYDAPGVHPIYGTALRPITPEIAEQWISNAGLPNTTEKEIETKQDTISIQPTISGPTVLRGADTPGHCPEAVSGFASNKITRVYITPGCPFSFQRTNAGPDITMWVDGDRSTSKTWTATGKPLHFEQEISFAEFQLAKKGNEEVYMLFHFRDD